MTADQLRIIIRNGLSCDHVEVLGDDGQHFEAVLVSPQFTGKNMVQQHQLVYLALGDRMRAEIHALSMRTFTPEAWAQSAMK
jgi:acid stress-induced BolA-like protein IbaG/YrbA